MILSTLAEVSCKFSWSSLSVLSSIDSVSRNSTFWSGCWLGKFSIFKIVASALQRQNWDGAVIPCVRLPRGLVTKWHNSDITISWGDDGWIPWSPDLKLLPNSLLFLSRDKVLLMHEGFQSRNWFSTKAAWVAHNFLVILPHHHVIRGGFEVGPSVSPRRKWHCLENKGGKWHAGRLHFEARPRYTACVPTWMMFLITIKGCLILREEDRHLCW